MAQKYEYKVLNIYEMSDEELGKTLCSLGQNGWQIVSNRSTTRNGAAGLTTGLILSRPEDEKISQSNKRNGKAG